MASVTDATRQRRRIVVQGIVQGVGFRPFVYGQALQWALTGFVRNDSGGVTIEVEGTPAALDGFLQAFATHLPPLAHIDSLVSEAVPPQHATTFVIAASQAGAERSALISPDTATCADCLRELFDPADRRYLYPFINCTNCGPRFTIVLDVPYDRALTTMRDFAMCDACQAEYDNPLDRRFHAQPNVCPVCGPRVALVDAQGHPIDGAEPLAHAAEMLARGAILAVKGLGGYHLACDAYDAAAVTRLRQRKHREAKPFALMVPTLDDARRLCLVSADEALLLQSRRRPIVLLQRRAENGLADAVAPGCETLGVMLPYTPLHAVLLRAYAAAQSAHPLPVLVMTSGNLSDEPIAYRDADAQQRLAALADATLRHDRAIHVRADDSVVRHVAGGTQLLRRSRGYAPAPLTLAQGCPVPVLATGSHLKNTLCLAKGQQAFVSHHIGDLENVETLTAFREAVTHFERLFDIEPQALAHDLHPEYLATKYALDAPIATKIGVQHHHAHIASVLVEHGVAGPVIGVAADGTGYGLDGAIWGCEVLTADLCDFERQAHLAYVPLPGGEQAVHQPWRMGAAYLAQAYGDAFLDLPIPFVRQLDRGRWQTLAQMIARRLNCPPTSSLGRLFDGVAALLGSGGEVLYEGQAAIELERLAASSTEPPRIYPYAIGAGPPALLDVQPLTRALVEDVARGTAVAAIAANFHASVAALLAAACVQTRDRTGLNVVALSGGVFQNRRLLEGLVAQLSAHGFQVLLNRQVPPNDGGLSLGQVAVAAARLRAC